MTGKVELVPLRSVNEPNKQNLLWLYAGPSARQYPPSRGNDVAESSLSVLKISNLSLYGTENHFLFYMYFYEIAILHKNSRFSLSFPSERKHCCSSSAWRSLTVFWMMFQWRFTSNHYQDFNIPDLWTNFKWFRSRLKIKFPSFQFLVQAVLVGPRKILFSSTFLSQSRHKS